MTELDHTDPELVLLDTDESEGAPPSASGTLYVGIDLGTSRSAVAASNGVREVVGSVVGYPRDRIANRIHGRSVLFGARALEHRLSCDLVYPLEDGNLAYTELDEGARAQSRQAAEELLREIVRLARPRPEQRVCAVIGAPAEATARNKHAILDLAAQAGIDSAMVVSEPFAVAYSLEVLDDAIVIDIGAGTIDLCRLHGTFPEVEDQVTIFRAGNFVDQQLAERIGRNHPRAQFTINMIKKAKERFSRVVDSDERAIVRFPVEGKPTDLDVTEELRETVGMLIPEILGGIQKLVASFDPEFQHRIRDQVYLAGGGSQIFGLRKALGEGMEEIGGGQLFLVEEPVFCGASGALKMAREMPQTYWEKLRG